MSEILFDNGETYVSEHDGELWFSGRLASRDDLDGLRAYFQAERDEQLGWWRASPGFVVKPHAGDNGIGSRSVNVLNERLGITKPVWEVEESRSEYGIAARAYFDAHPEPKPWHDARPGEAWVITVGGTEMPALVARKTHEDPLVFKTGFFEHDLTSPSITAGRRVWAPEEAADA